MTDEPQTVDLGPLNARLDAIAQAVEELKTAKTPAAKAEASDDLDDAEEAFARYAQSKGISRDEAVAALDKMREDNETARMRTIIKKIMEEDYEIVGDEDGKKEDKPQDGDKTGEKKPSKPKPDTAPDAAFHWTDRKLSDLLT